MVYRRSRKVPFNCYMSVDQMDALDRISEREGRPRAQLVREALARYLVEVGEGQPGSEGQPASEEQPASEGQPAL